MIAPRANMRIVTVARPDADTIVVTLADEVLTFLARLDKDVGDIRYSDAAFDDLERRLRARAERS